MRDRRRNWALLLRNQFINADLPLFYSQHHRLPPTSAPANPGVLSASANSRLNEFFDLIKSEFDAVGTDGSVWKAQRDEYEQKSRSSTLFGPTFRI